MRAEGFFYNLDKLYGGLGIGKLQFLKKIKNQKKFSAVIFFKFLAIKALDPDWIRIRIGLQPQTLDPDPDPEKINTDPQPLNYNFIESARDASPRLLAKPKAVNETRDC